MRRERERVCLLQDLPGRKTLRQQLHRENRELHEAEGLCLPRIEATI